MVEQPYGNSNRNIALLVLVNVILSAILLSMLRLQYFWIVQPWAGDFPFYVQSCLAIPNGEHPFVPTILYLVNLLIHDPVSVTFFISGLGYVLIFLLVYFTAQELTGNIKASVIGYLCFISMFPMFITPTAIKNMYGIAFMLLSIIFLHRYTKQHKLKMLAAFCFSTSLTIAAHSIPFIPLTIILLVNSLTIFHSDKKLLTLTVISSIVGCLVLSALGKIAKLFDIARIFAAKPLEIIAINITKYAKTSFLSVILFTVILVYTISSSRQWTAMFTGLVLATFMLLFIGDIEYGERLIENASPLIALVIGCGLSYTDRYCRKVKGEL